MRPPHAAGRPRTTGPGGGSRTEAEAAPRAAHTAAALRAGPLWRKIELLGQRGPPAAGRAGRSAVPTEGSTLSDCVARADRRGGGARVAVEGRTIRSHRLVRSRAPRVVLPDGPTAPLMTFQARSGPVRPADTTRFMVRTLRASSLVKSHGMRSDTAVQRRRAEAAAIERSHGRAFPQVDPGVVGLAGLEPAASSLSGIEGSALCGPTFSQVAVERQGPRDAF